MINKFTIINLKPDISTIDFEQLNKTNEPVISIETSKTNSLAKTGNYQPPLVKKTQTRENLTY